MSSRRAAAGARVSSARVPKDVEELVRRYLSLGWTRPDIERMSYTLAEQLHQHTCVPRGLYSHRTARPDQDVAISMLVNLFDVGWYMYGRNATLPVTSVHDSTFVIYDPPEG